MLTDCFEVSKEQREYLKYVVEITPLATFQALNKYLNGMGLCLSISTVEEVECEKCKP
jgi:hypothetical protein